MSDEKAKRKKYIVVAILAALLLLGGTITAVCIANSNNNAVQVAEQSTESSVQSSVTESSTESTTAESSTVSENSTKENSATAETSKTAQESSNTSSKAETSKTETSTKPETSKAESSNNNNQTSTMPETSKNDSSTTPPQSQRPTSSENSTPTTPTKPTTIAVTSISLDRSSVSMTVGDKVTLVATVNPGNATNKSYEFSSSNNDVATVNSNGTVVAKKAGSCTITVKSSNGKSAKCSVTVKAKASTGSNTSGNNGGTSSTSQKPPANAPVVKDSYGNSVYECPEIVAVVNKYRTAAGLKPVVWCDNESDYKFFYEDNSEFTIKMMQKRSPELFDENGNYIPDVTRAQNYMATRNAITYMISNKTIGHSPNTEDSASIQIGGGTSFSPEDWVKAAMDNRGSYNQLMHPDIRSIYCCYGYANGGYYVAIM